MTARYVVTAFDPSLPIRQRVRLNEETEEPEALAAWAAREYPRACVTVQDRHAGDTLTFRPAPKEDEP